MTGNTDRRMIFPYTIAARVAHFPFKFYYNNVPLFKYTVWSFFMCIPFFYKMQKLSCSEENYIKYAEYKRKEREEYEHHKEHLL